MVENFNFHGAGTTFINHPKDTVIRDFQNTYRSGPAVEDLRSLLDLVLSSRDLADADREAAAQEVHTVARLAEDPQQPRAEVRTRLERLRAVLAGAADIAQPALVLLAAIASAFTG
ncbi:hypothetical protein GXW82_11300 [Streptacidiphilus sp. 4-A2]|nr:hypothetical protein [Streptacidiphilus sp. 4-A2]